MTDRLADDTRIEGGAVVCRHCNRVLTFNFIDRPAGRCPCRAEKDGAMTTTPNLDKFIAVHTNDDDCLALGLDTLRAAKSEADEHHLTGWSDQILEYVIALEDGRGLNRPI